MSNINPQNIDGTYPIAGQDNNSQGFRDNFTNTINNFTFAAAELTDLQTYAVLKGPLGSVGQTGTPTNDMNYAFLTAAQLVESVETINQIGNVSAGGSQTLDWTDGHFQTISVTSAATLSFASTWPPTNHWTKLRLRILSYNNTAVTFPATVTENISNINGFVSGTTVNLSAGVHEFEFTTYDNGSTVAIHDLMSNLGPVVQQFKPAGNTVTAFSANIGTDKLLLTPTVATYAGAVVTLPNTTSNGTTVSIAANFGIAALQVLGSWDSVVSPSANITTTMPNHWLDLPFFTLSLFLGSLFS
jgi:hypothetical protein